MGQVIALIPARSGSKSCPGKNLRRLGGVTLIEHAIRCTVRAGIKALVVSTDIPWTKEMWAHPWPSDLGQLEDVDGRWLKRPDELCSDTAAMIDVVRHVIERTPGEPDQMWVLLQPTAVLRTPERVREAVRLLETTGADSVVSVVRVRPTYAPEFQLWIDRNRLRYDVPWEDMPTRRQDTEPNYVRDGTVYAFRRATVERYGTIYGQDVRPLILDPSETCELDTEADWAAVEARWERERG